MTPDAQITQRSRALLIQSLERHWPGCGAHSKRDLATGRVDIAFNDVRLPRAIDAIRSYVDGWEAGAAALLSCLEAEVPFPATNADALQRRQRPGSAGRQRVSDRDDRSARARAGLEALFSHTQGMGGDREA